MTTNLALCFQYVPSAFLLTLSTSLIEIGFRSSVTYGLPYESAGGPAPLGGYSGVAFLSVSTRYRRRVVAIATLIRASIAKLYSQFVGRPGSDGSTD